MNGNGTSDDILIPAFFIGQDGITFKIRILK